jgi:hypothetical protein
MIVNTKRNWMKVNSLVVLALASLSSLAFSAPHRDSLDVLPDHTLPVVCSENSQSAFDQYLAAIEATEQGWTGSSLTLSVSCFEDSKAFFDQYQAAIQGAESAPATLPDLSGEQSQVYFAQYQAAIEAAEQGWSVAPVLTGANSRERFEQYQAAIDSTQ